MTLSKKLNELLESYEKHQLLTLQQWKFQFCAQ